MRAFSLVPGHHGVDVVLHHAHQGGVVVDLVHPVWQLGVPHEGVAAHLLSVLRRPVGNLVGAAEAELSTVGLGGIPLHGIFGCDGAELGLDNVLFAVVVANGERSTDVCKSSVISHW